MKDIPHFALVLTLVASISAGSLAWLNKITKPKIILQQKTELIEGIKNVLPGSENGSIEEIKNEKAGTSFFKGFIDKNKSRLIGYAALIAPQGYSSNIRTIVGIDSACNRILSVKILSQKETPGLGTKCEDTTWLQQFVDKELASLAVDKDGGTIQSITGATITSRAVTDGIAARIKTMQIELGKN